jgi:hypothetical protein
MMPGFTTATFETATSVAGVCPLEAPTVASGGEIMTVAPGRKFAPIKVILRWSAPCPVNSGETLVRLGEGAALATICAAFEVCARPPKGLKTVTTSGAEVARSDAKTVAASCSELLNTVGRLLPLICTTELARKPLPVTVKVKVVLPDETEAGLMLVMNGVVCALVAWHMAVMAISKRSGTILDEHRGEQ